MSSKYSYLLSPNTSAFASYVVRLFTESLLSVNFMFVKQHSTVSWFPFEFKQLIYMIAVFFFTLIHVLANQGFNYKLGEEEMENKKIAFIKKSSIIWIVSLVAIDQAIKLFIAHFLMESHFTIIPHVFTFKTMQNIHLGWIPNMFDFMMPLYMAVIISVIAILILILYYRYWVFCTFKWGKYSRIPTIFLTLVMAGGFCKLIDDIFLGGTLDYIQLFDWFIFDLKDVYLTTIAFPLWAFYVISYKIHLHKLPKEKYKEEKMKQRFWYWVKLGFPMKP